MFTYLHLRPHARARNQSHTPTRPPEVPVDVRQDAAERHRVLRARQRGRHRHRHLLFAHARRVNPTTRINRQALRRDDPKALLHAVVLVRASSFPSPGWDDAACM